MDHRIQQLGDFVHAGLHTGTGRAIQAGSGKSGPARPGGRRRRGAGPSSAGFTLVELLVVLAIIGVLMSLLMPALGAARERARMAACLSNLRQIALGAISHAGDKRVIPPHRETTLNGTPAQASRWEYAKNEGANTPGAVASTAQDFYPKLFADLLCDGGYAVDKVFDCPSKPDDGSLSGPDSGAGTASDRYGRISSGGKPSRRIFNYAMNGRINGDSGSVRPNWCLPVNPAALREGAARAMLYCDNVGTATYAVWYTSAAGVHDRGSRSNFAFFDGHAETWELSQHPACFNSGGATDEDARQFWLWYSRNGAGGL